MIKKFILILLIIFVPLSSIAANWQLYFTNQLGSKFYIDKNSINILENGNVRSWTKIENQDANGTMSLKEVNCIERTYTIRAMEPIDKNDIESMKSLNALVEQWSKPTQYWEHFSSSDLAEAEYKLFCSGR